MNVTIHKILCWIVALSLAGLPIINVSADLYDQSGSESCHYVDIDSQSDSSVTNSIDSSDNCCSDACQCPVMAVCQTNMHNQISLTPEVFATIKHTGKDRVLLTYISNYHSRNIPPDIQPPII